MRRDAGDRDDRHRAERDGELDHPGLEDEPGREQEGVPPDRRHGAITARERALELDGATVRGMPHVRARRAPRARRGRPRSTRAAARELVGEDSARLAISARVGARFDVSLPGCVGTTFQSSTSSARPSSASARCTIVAVASAGPLPVSWRSEVNGMPETRAPR